jgi:LacI family transcriptional regulator
VIRLRITQGNWQDALPGERSLAELLGVGRDTVRLALQLLERDKVISPSQAGSKRKIRMASNHREKSKSDGLRIGMLSPRRIEQLSQPMLFEVDHLRQALAIKDGALELFAPGWYDDHKPEKRLVQLLKDEPCDAWILFRSSSSIQRWFEESQVPCLIRGYPQANIQLPHLDVDWEATARHAAGRLWRLGHRRVGILTPPEALEGVKAAVRGATELGEPGFSALEIPENGTVDGVIHALSRAFKHREPPTALIATRPRQAASAMTWLAAQGIRLPSQMSIISLAYEPFFDYIFPLVSGYRVHPETVSKQVIRRIEALVAGNPNRRSHSWISPTIVKGASVAELP